MIDCSMYIQDLLDWYRRVTKKNLDLNNPITFNDKIQWLKIYDMSLLKTNLTDKYLVRNYIKEKIGEEYLIPLLAVHNQFDDIDFNSLPNKYIMKCNHGCGFNIIVRNKDNFDKNDAKRKMDGWLKRNYFNMTAFETQYKNIQPRIIIEDYLKEEGRDLYEYQLWCFLGNIEFISVILGPHEKNEKLSYDIDWNLLPFVTSYPKMTHRIEKPDNLDTLVKLAKTLSDGFIFVRVDFYIKDSKIYFGEMTFTPACGLVSWTPQEYDTLFGSKMILPKERMNN
jgi:hypothetical protein